MNWISSGCMEGDLEGCFQLVHVPNGFIRQVAGTPLPELWTELKTSLKDAGGDSDSSHTKLEFDHLFGGYTHEELAACDQIASILLKIKPRHVKHLIFSMVRDSSGLLVAERIAVASKIKVVRLMSNHTAPVRLASAQDGQAMANILLTKAVTKVEFHGLVFESVVFEGVLAAALSQRKVDLTFRECVFLGNLGPLANAISTNKKLAIVKFHEMPVNMASHDFSVRLIDAAASSKIQILVAPVPIWSERMELAVAQFIAHRGNRMVTLSLDVPDNMVQLVKNPGEMIVHVLKHNFSTTDLTLFDEDDPWQRPYLRQFTNLFGPETGALIYCYSRLNKLGRMHSIAASYGAIHAPCYHTLAYAGADLDYLLIHLKEIPGIFGKHALTKHQMEAAAAAASGGRKRKATTTATASAAQAG